jgi:hypothetical protein
MNPYVRLAQDMKAVQLYFKAHPPEDPYLKTLLLSLINTFLDYSERCVRRDENIQSGDDW